MSSSLVACLLTQKELTMRKKDKDVLQFEYMLVYEDCLDIYEIILREGET